MISSASIKKLSVVLFLGIIVASYLFLDPDVISLENLQSYRQQIAIFQSENASLTGGLFFVAYVLTTTFSIPIAVGLTLLGGALFGLGWGLALISFASSIGATLSFLLSRYLFRDALTAKYGATLQKFNDGIEKEGAFYLFALRLVPLFPFFLINIVAGLSRIKPSTYYGVSQLGMLPGTAVYVYAGTQLSTLNSLSDITSPSLLVAFGLLAVFPILTKKLLSAWRN